MNDFVTQTSSVDMCRTTCITYIRVPLLHATLLKACKPIGPLHKAAKDLDQSGPGLLWPQPGPGVIERESDNEISILAWSLSRRC